MRIGIVGCGAIVESAHLPALAKLGYTPTVLIDPDLTSAKALAKRFDVRNVVGDISEALTLMDAAIVATPPFLHEPICTQLLEAGIPVLVEKPMACTSVQCYRMLAAADRGGVTLTVGLTRRCFQVNRWLKALLAEGALGKVLEFKHTEGVVFAWPVKSPAFFDINRAGGGVLIDIGSHALDLLTYFLGDFSQVNYADDYQGGVEADCQIEITLASGVKGTVALSRLRNLANTFWVKGEKGEIEISLHGYGVISSPKSLMSVPFAGIMATKIPQENYPDLFVTELSEWLEGLDGKKTTNALEAAKTIDWINYCYANRRSSSLVWETM